MRGRRRPGERAWASLGGRPTGTAAGATFLLALLGGARRRIKYIKIDLRRAPSVKLYGACAARSGRCF
jgi:hypothetical protein